jgi:hypothetical protein
MYPVPSNQLSSNLVQITQNATSRVDIWVEFINSRKITTFAEIGVWRGEFAEAILSRCRSIERYYMLDPWRHLEEWNKPSNVSDIEFSQIFEEAMQRTAFAANKRIVLRDKTRDAIKSIPNGDLDAAYIDGDHTLRGITIDLLSIYEKITPRGFLMGDDFARSVWQHSTDYEPTLVFPMAVYFAEGKGDKIFGLPHDQFLIQKSGDHEEFEFEDLTGKYELTMLRRQFLQGPKRRSNKILDRLVGKFLKLR